MLPFLRQGQFSPGSLFGMNHPETRFQFHISISFHETFYQCFDTKCNIPNYYQEYLQAIVFFKKNKCILKISPKFQTKF
jgi:hypothetical protein